MNLSVGYGLPVCPEVDLHVEPGGVLAVVGANGVGKSTLLRTLAGRQAPLAGETLAFGVPVDERSVHFRSRTAVELGEDAFLPSLTVTEHLLMVCYGHGVPDAPGVVQRLVTDFGLADRADALPAALSSGQRRRLLLASVFARPRSLIILDEPEQRLDATMRDTVGGLLAEEAAAGCAVLIATHDPRLVRRAATTVLAISEREVRWMQPEDGARHIQEGL